MNQISREISYDYIRGLTDGEGCFTFTTSGNVTLDDGSIVKVKIPAFVIAMNERDADLIAAIKNKLQLKNRIYNHKSSIKDGYNRGRMARLMVRDLGQLKNIIVPLFYKKLIGYKAIQFHEWIKKIESDPGVPKSFELIHKLYFCGFYDKNNKFD